MKDIIETIVVVMGILVLIFGLVYGLTKLYEYRTQQWTSDALDSCLQISKLSGVNEAKIGDNYSCLFVKDGKIVEVKDW